MWGREDAVGTRGTGMEDAGTRGAPCPLQPSATPGTATERRAPRQPPGPGTFSIGTARTGAGTVPHPTLCHSGGPAAPNALREEPHSGETEARGAGAGEEEKLRGGREAAAVRSSRKRGVGRKLTPRVPRRIPPRDPSRGGEEGSWGIPCKQRSSEDLLTLPLSSRWESRSSHRDRSPPPCPQIPSPGTPAITQPNPQWCPRGSPPPPRRHPRGSPPPIPLPHQYPPLLFPSPRPPSPLPHPRWQPLAPLPARAAPALPLPRSRFLPPQSMDTAHRRILSGVFTAGPQWNVAGQRPRGALQTAAARRGGKPRSGAPQSPLRGRERGHPKNPSVFLPPQVRDGGRSPPAHRGAPSGAPQSDSPPTHMGALCIAASPHNPRFSPGSPRSAARPGDGGWGGEAIGSFGPSAAARARGVPSALSTPAPGAGAAGGAGSRC